MAPPKKKVGNTSKADSNTATNSSSSTAAASTKQQVPVSTRPKRHAEKRFYDDIEDERPQHLAAKTQRKKRATAAAATDYDDELAPMSNGHNGGREGGRKAGGRGATSSTHGGGGRGGRQSEENGRDDVEPVERQEGRGYYGSRGNTGRGASGRGGRPRQRRRTAAIGWRGRFSNGVDDDGEEKLDDVDGGRGTRGVYHDEEDTNNDNWAQCDTCRKWRRLPDFVDPKKLPAKWYCDMNKFDPARASCRAPQEETHSTQLDEEDQETGRGTRSYHRRRQQDTGNGEDSRKRGLNYGDDDQDYDDDGEDEDEDLDNEENQVKDDNLRRFLAAWARRIKGEDKAVSRIVTSMSTRGKRKPMGDTHWVRCQNCGKWRALLKSMDPSIYVGPGLKFYCLMNTWHESLASCSAPQENNYSVANLFPPQDPPESATDYDDAKDIERVDGEEAFAGRKEPEENDDERRGAWSDDHGGREYSSRLPLAQFHQPITAGPHYGYEEQRGRQSYRDEFYP